MKYSYLLMILFAGLCSAQRLKVIDSENDKAIPHARVILSNQVVYTNEDGFAPVSQDARNFEISASGYQKKIITVFNSRIKLTPAYKNVGEVKIVSVDIRKLLGDVSKNYHKRYYNEPSLYDVVYKEKKLDNNKLYFLVIAETKLWSKSNHYNYKDGIRKNYDEILQMQLNNVKYLKNVKGDSIFTTGTNEFSHEYMGNYFFNFELNRTLNHIKSDGAKYSGKMIFEEGDEQLIKFKIKSGVRIELEGEFKYNKTDKVITYFEVHYVQTGYPPVRRKTADGVEYDYQLGDASLIFDFYKKDGMYLPALTRFEGDKYSAFYLGKKHERKFSREIIYNTFEKSNKEGLSQKVDFGKNIWENVPVKEEKEDAILLSADEQAFINEK
ncbi:hypothetical protein SAMN05421866_0308 [Chryseobacterium oranimense]|uniref:CarboxypepD_reg-like domain-containing protein n=1 Tax=Chryseobacterium oranimense TaxID=421058 RepID=A0A1M5JHG2_9FLAO|nr:hypothetical protein [Chryseobacterium oranimense]SHG39971.1 hypothetical protein SAMN05421866_0308 [Chryseobacterium oranimense]